MTLLLRRRQVAKPWRIIIAGWHRANAILTLGSTRYSDGPMLFKPMDFQEKHVTLSP